MRRLLARYPGKIHLGLLVGWAAFDYWCACNDITGDSFSECVRNTLHTDTPAGRAAFIGVWCGVTAWFIPHILRGPREEIPHGNQYRGTGAVGA